MTPLEYCLSPVPNRGSSGFVDHECRVQVPSKISGGLEQQLVFLPHCRSRFPTTSQLITVWLMLCSNVSDSRAFWSTSYVLFILTNMVSWARVWPNSIRCNSESANIWMLFSSVGVRPQGWLTDCFYGAVRKSMRTDPSTDSDGRGVCRHYDSQLWISVRLSIAETPKVSEPVERVMAGLVPISFISGFQEFVCL